MFKKRKAQGISITIVVIAIVAIIVLVVLIALFTESMGGFAGTIKKTATCENSCEALAMERDTATFGDRKECTNAGNKHLPGTYDDVTSGVCCCSKKTTTTTTATTTTT